MELVLLSEFLNTIFKTNNNYIKYTHNWLHTVKSIIRPFLCRILCFSSLVSVSSKFTELLQKYPIFEPKINRLMYTYKYVYNFILHFLTNNFRGNLMVHVFSLAIIYAICCLQTSDFIWGERWTHDHFKMNVWASFPIL